MSVNINIQVDDDVIYQYSELKHQGLSYLTCMPNDTRSKIIVEYCERSKATEDNGYWNKFVESLPPKKACYAFATVNVDGVPRTVFITWVPEAARIMDKAQVERSQPVLRKKLIGINRSFTATTIEDLNLTDVTSWFKK